MKTVLLIAFIGHILCGICDCLLSYSPNGRLDLKGALKSPEKMREVFSDYPIKWSLLSIMLGVYAITAFGFGYLVLSRWMEQYSDTASAVMYISAVVFPISIVVHHIICSLVEWLYVRLGKTDEAREAALDFQKKTIATMAVGVSGSGGICYHTVHYGNNGKDIAPAVGVRNKHITSYDRFAPC